MCAVASAVILSTAPCCALSDSRKPETDGGTGTVQNISYTESTDRINNPDQGFYVPVYVKATDAGLSYNKNVVTASTQLYHLRIDISEFSAAVNGTGDKPLTEEVLNGLDGLLSYLYENEKNAAVRFAYDPGYNGSKDKEPEQQIILRHIGQVCPVLNSYQTTVTAIEAGLIGPWGEMHSSAIANAEHITPVIEAFLTQTESLPVLVRTPKMIYDYLGITVNDIDGYQIGQTSDAYRLGIYNDGYLGSGNDLGTYTDREREIEFLSRQTAHLPYGGEVVTPSSTLHDIENCLPEMFEINLSYLNVQWNDTVIEKWRNTTYSANCGDDEIYYGLSAFTYIENRMGYRFLVTNSTFEYADAQNKLTVNLTLNNLGFGNLNKSKRAELLFADGNGEVKFIKQVENFTGAESLSCSAELDLESGKYGVYLRLYGEKSEEERRYCLQFANEDIWNAQFKANKIGEINLQS